MAVATTEPSSHGKKPEPEFASTFFGESKGHGHENNFEGTHFEGETVVGKDAIHATSDTVSTEEDNSKETGKYYSEEKGNVGRAIIFCLIGCSVLWYWGSMLQYIAPLTAAKMPDYNRASDTLTIVFEATVLICTAFFTWRGYFNLNLALGGTAMWVVVYVVTGVLATCVQGKNLNIGLHVVAVCAGIAQSCWEAVECGLAAAMPKPMGHWVSCGWALSGSLAFIVWVIVSKIWPDNVVPSVWVIVACGLILVLCAAGSLIHFRRTPTISRRIVKMKEHLAEEASDPNRPSYFWIFKQAWPMLGGIWLTYFITFWATPNIAPFRMPIADNPDDVTALLGTQQIAYFAGNWICTLGRFWSGFVPGDTAYHCINIGRVVFLILYLCMWRYQEVEAFKNMYFQGIIMALFNISYGWLVSLGYSKAPRRLENERYRGRVGSMSCWFMIFGIVVGLVVAKITAVIGGEGW